MKSQITKIDLFEDLKIDDSISVSSPFETLEYLRAMEQSDSASEKSGWLPDHLGEVENKNLTSFLPIYKKFNSYGEFIFDHQWANALHGAGRNYYPKLLTAIPFTPCEGERILGKDEATKIRLIEACIDKLQEEEIESWHVLFPGKPTALLLRDRDFVERFNYRFVWQNDDFGTFDDFLSIFTARQRSTIRKERKSIVNAQVTFSCKSNDEITKEDWDLFYTFYQQTYFEHGQQPYLTREFFNKINTQNPLLKPVIFFAHDEHEAIAASLCFEGPDTLYGRHWGTLKNVKNLHFECCYYQGIEYCIKNKIKFFDPGVQGEHKIRRGFQPKLTSSFHYFLAKDLSQAVQGFCKSEKKQIEDYVEACKSYTPFNKDYKIK